MRYDFEMKRVIGEIKKAGAKKICLQFPDGLKQNALEIADDIKSKTGCSVYIWMSSNFGACDFPFFLEHYGFDAVFNFGHSAY